jgi:predicted  nucleic acid-binding Zn-ribbon protein
VPTVTVLTSKVSALEGQLAAAERERKEMQSALLQLPAMKERDAALEKLVKDGEAERRDMCRELLQLRERMAKLEGLQEAKPNGVKPAVATVPAKKEP